MEPGTSPMPQLTDPVAISLGPLDVRWYALFILLGIVSAISLSYWLAGQRGLDGGFLLDIAPWVVFLSIAGARFYYVMLEWDRFKDDLLGALNLRGGGLSIHGAIIVGIITLVVLCRIYDQPARLWMDLIVPGVALGQAIGRWGNWANQEAFGKPTDLPWAVTIDPVHRPAGYEQNATFHPTFLYESLFNVVNAAVLSWLVLRGPRLGWLRSGDVAALYLIAYGVARFIIEQMRTDSLYIGPLPAALWLSMAMIGGGIALMVMSRTIFTDDEIAPQGA
jgi:phosphatidylglycerol:prolipoprotein diacylglycerol transferase